MFIYFLFPGMISVRSQPVALGCVEGQNFVGFIDEVSIARTQVQRFEIEFLPYLTDNAADRLDSKLIRVRSRCRPERGCRLHHMADKFL